MMTAGVFGRLKHFLSYGRRPPSRLQRITQVVFDTGKAAIP
jgi:hypothetical protein